MGDKRLAKTPVTACPPATDPAPGLCNATAIMTAIVHESCQIELGCPGAKTGQNRLKAALRLRPRGPGNANFRTRVYLTD